MPDRDVEQNNRFDFFEDFGANFSTDGWRFSRRDGSLDPAELQVTNGYLSNVVTYTDNEATAAYDLPETVGDFSVSFDRYHHAASAYYLPRDTFLFEAAGDEGFAKYALFVRVMRSSYGPDYESASANFDKPRISLYEYGGAGYLEPSIFADMSTTSLLDRWITTSVTFDTDTGTVSVDVDGDQIVDATFTNAALIGAKLAGLEFQNYGWFTGHYGYLDNLSISGYAPGSIIEENQGPEWRGGLDIDDIIFDLDNANINVSINLNDYFVDPDGDVLTFEMSGITSGLTLDSMTGVISGRFSGELAPNGTVSFSASDPTGASLTSGTNTGGFGPPTDGPVTPETGILSVGISGVWKLKEGSETIFEDASEGTILIGHADGIENLIRVEGAKIETDGKLLKISGGVFYAEAAGVRDPLFTGDVTLDLETGRSTSFKEERGDYPADADFDLANGAAEVTFGAITVARDEVRFGTDISLGFLDEYSTSGNIVDLTVSQSGIDAKLGQLGTGTWFNKDPLVISTSQQTGSVSLSFSNLGIGYNSVADVIYFMGKAEAQVDLWGASRTVEIDLSGEIEPESSAFAPGDKYLSYSPSTGWEFVGSVTYKAGAALDQNDPFSTWGIKEVTLEVDTVADSVTGATTALLPILSAELGVEVTGYWNPFELEGFKASVDDLELGPVFGFYLTGGSVELSGLADRVVSKDNKWSITAEASHGLPDIALFTGSLNVAAESNAKGKLSKASGTLKIEASVEQLMDAEDVRALKAGITPNNAVVSSLNKWFGIEAQDVLDYKFLEFDAKLEYNLSKGVAEFDANFAAFSDMLVGQVKFTSDVDGSWSFLGTAAANIPSTIDVIGGRQIASMNIYATYSVNENFTDDYVAAWMDVSIFNLSISKGIRIGFDGAFDFIGTSEIKLIGSWLLEDTMEWAIMSATWDLESHDTELIVIKPDGTRLTEAELADEPDIEIVTDLSSGFSRSVAVRTPESGIWDIEVASSTGLGDIRYEASQGIDVPEVELTTVSAETETRTLHVDLTATGAELDTTVRIFIDTDAEGLNGIEITQTALISTNNALSYAWDYSGAASGRYYVYTVAENAQTPIVSDYWDAFIDLNLVRGTSGNDNLNGTSDGELIEGIEGNDWITPGQGFDTVDGGAGADMVSFVDAPLAIRADLSLGIATVGEETKELIEIENLTGSIYGDYIVGDANDNRFRGLGDYDWFVGSDGRDIYEGGNGRDMVSYTNAKSGVTVDLAAGNARNTGQAYGDQYDGIERVTGSVFVDTFYGSDGSDDFRGLGGYDVFYGSKGGRERYDGGNGSDTVTYVNSNEGVIANLARGFGTGGDARLDLYTSIENLGGTAFNDVLTGNDDRNNLRALAGDDIIFGGGGIDRISGGRGNDTIDGGDGSDYILFNGSSTEFEIVRETNTRNATVSWNGPGGGDGTDTLINVEYLVFDDRTYDIWSL